MTGRLRTVVYTPRTNLPTLEADLYDGSDVVTLVWLGRRHIAGIEPGRATHRAGAGWPSGTTARSSTTRTTSWSSPRVTAGRQPGHRAADRPEDEEPLPCLLRADGRAAGRLCAGWSSRASRSRSSCVVNFLGDIHWSLRPALIVAVGGGAAIAVLPAEPAASRSGTPINGLFGIAIGAIIAWQTGDATGLLPARHPATRSATASAMLLSVGDPAARWSAGSGRSWSTRARPAWRDDPRLRAHLRLADRALGASSSWPRSACRSGLYLAHQDDRPAGRRPARAGLAAVRAAAAITVWRCAGDPGIRPPAAARR